MSTTTTTKTCNSCTYWKATETTKGECHRQAPQSFVFKIEPGMKYEAHFPLTKATEWCGEFKAK